MFRPHHLACVALTACMAGPLDDTRVEELRVVSVEASPLEADPLAEVAAYPGHERLDPARPLPKVAAHILDETDSEEPWVAATWACDLMGTYCWGPDSSSVTPIGTGLSNLWEAEWSPLPVVPYLAKESPVPLSVWTLVCHVDACPILSGPEDTLDVAELGDPTLTLDGAPLRGATLVRNTVWVGDGSDPLTNPTIQLLEPLPTQVKPEEEVVVVLVGEPGQSGATLAARGVTNGGGFGSLGETFVDNEVELTWYAPTEPGLYGLWLVGDEEGGGSATISAWIDVSG